MIKTSWGFANFYFSIWGYVRTKSLGTAALEYQNLSLQGEFQLRIRCKNALSLITIKMSWKFNSLVCMSLTLFATELNFFKHKEKKPALN